jgi:hypothetical protein
MMIVVIRANKRETEGKKRRKQAVLEKRERQRKEHRLTIDVHHCLTSKTDKTLND